LIKIGSMSFEL